MAEPNENQTGLKSGADLHQFVRSSAATAAEQQGENQGYFNAMSWLDMMLEEHPHMFDEFFDKSWHELSDSEQSLRLIQIRKVL